MSNTRRPAGSRTKAAAPAVEQEVEQEGLDYIEVPLGGQPIRVRPWWDWRASVFRALNMLNFDAFVAKVIHPDDRALFFDIDPTQLQVAEFSQEVAAQAGGDLGKPNASPR